MKHVPRLFQLCRDNSGGDRLFPTAVPSSNEAASAVCEWRPRGQRDDQRAARPDTKAEFAASHYTAKRMIMFLDFTCHQERKR